MATGLKLFLRSGHLNQSEDSDTNGHVHKYPQNTLTQKCDMFDTNPTWINEGATLVLQAEQALGPLSFKHRDVEEIVPKRWNLAIQKPRQPGTGLPTQLHLICISEYGYAYGYIEYLNIDAIKKK